MENIGFRCASTVKRIDRASVEQSRTRRRRGDAAAAAPSPAAATDSERPPRRAPRRHYYNETWEYKVKKILHDVMTGDVDSADSVLKGLKNRDKKAKDEL